MLDDPPIVHKGDRVMLEVRRGGLLVQALGLAKAEGKSGDTILVQNKKLRPGSDRNDSECWFG